jgi:hypothetical protein
MNLTLGAIEIWGPSARVDSLAQVFTHLFAQKGLIDIESVKLRPTWSNRWVGAYRVAKRLDRFMLAEDLVKTLHLMR